MTNFTLHTGNNIDVMRTFEDNSFDAVITDPPYGIDFLGKSWDANTGALETYQECLRVLKPGGYLLAFSAARTYHHLAYTLEVAGFEIRDQLMWLYASGFPKAQDIGRAIQKRLGVEEYNEVFDDGSKSKSLDYGMKKSKTNKQIVATSPEAKQWAGWKTALKPAHEPICMARKPFKGSTIDNVLKHGVGALNIDATRVEVAEDEMESFQGNWDRVNAGMAEYSKLDGTVGHGAGQLADQMKDITGYKPEGRFPSNVLGEVEGYQKYFYCPKVSRKERHMGFEDLTGIITQEDMLKEMGGHYIDAPINQNIWLPHTGNIYIHGLKEEYIKWCKKNNKETGSMGNNHPTVKPVELMKYLIKLVTPANSRVLDPFNGSGSTGMAAVELGHEYVGIDLDPNYIEIARRRIEAWNEPEAEPEPANNFYDLFDEGC